MPRLRDETGSALVAAPPLWYNRINILHGRALQASDTESRLESGSIVWRERG